MTTLQVFYTTVPGDGIIALPPEFCGSRVDVVVRKEPDALLPEGDNDLRKPKTLDEIVAEQGGPRVCTNPASLWEDFPKLWNTEAELEDFLERRKY